MNNLQYSSGERNRYFSGKLMTVRDFEDEQTYFNDKRRLGNRMLHGAGVVAGLGVLLVDNQTFSLEAGMALDYLGREIVVQDPCVKRISAIRGFAFMERAGEEQDEEVRAANLQYIKRRKKKLYETALQCGDLLALMLGGLLLFLLADRTGWRRTGFFAGVCFGVFFAVTVVFAAVERHEQTDASEAIVLAQAASVKSSPEADGSDIFLIHEGTKVTILSEYDGWTEIMIADGNKGWVTSETIAAIAY